MARMRKGDHVVIGGDTLIEALTGLICGIVGFCVGVGVCTGDWHLALSSAAGFCFGRAKALWDKRAER